MLPILKSICSFPSTPYLYTFIHPFLDNQKRKKAASINLEARKMATAVEREDRTSSLQEQIENFVRSGELELKFPASLTTFERMLVHKVAESAGLLHESHGRGEARRITVRRRLPKGNLEKVDFRLQISLEKEYNLSDLLPVVRGAANPQFRITFVIGNVTLGVVPFEGLQSLLLPFSLPEVEVHLKRPPGTLIEISAIVSLYGTSISKGKFLLPSNSGTSCTSVQLDLPCTLEDDFPPGTQPPALKVCLTVDYSTSQSSSPAPSAAHALDRATSVQQSPVEENHESVSPSKEQQVHLIVIMLIC